MSATIRADVAVASQDVCVNAGFGAFTGELCAPMLLDSGIRWTLTGHSERRVGFCMPGETSEIVARKTSVAIAAGMSAIVCIGESLAQREAGETDAVCASQLAPVAAAIPADAWKNIVVAYEPVWAIGTGRVATPEQAEDTHLQIRNWIASNVSQEVADNMRIIYGGSVNGSNCATLIQCPNIDGFLVGGASLKPEFVQIINCTSL
jgi:triosephosphate isomerase